MRYFKEIIGDAQLKLMLFARIFREFFIYNEKKKILEVQQEKTS